MDGIAVLTYNIKNAALMSVIIEQLNLKFE